MINPAQYSFFKNNNSVFLDDEESDNPTKIGKLPSITPNRFLAQNFNLKSPLFTQRLINLDYLRGLILGAKNTKDQVQPVIKIISSAKDIRGVKAAVNYIARFVGFGEEVSKQNQEQANQDQLNQYQSNSLNESPGKLSEKLPEELPEELLTRKVKLRVESDTVLYNQDGKQITSKEEAEAIIKIWQKDFKKDQNIMSHMMFSIGGDEDKNKQRGFLATKKFLEDNLKARGFDYFLAAHYDTKNHHFHVIVKKKNNLGENLRFDKHDLFVLRDLYAKTLTAYGVKRASVARMDQKQILENIEKKLVSIREQNTHYQSKLAAVPANRFNAYVYKARIALKLEALIKETDYHKKNNKEMGFFDKVNLSNNKIELQSLKKQIVKSTNGEEIKTAIELTINSFAKDNQLLAKKLNEELNLDDNTKFAYLKPKETRGYFKQILERQLLEITKAEHQLQTDLKGTKLNQEERGVVKDAITYFDDMKQVIVKLRTELNKSRNTDKLGSIIPEHLKKTKSEKLTESEQPTPTSNQNTPKDMAKETEDSLNNHAKTEISAIKKKPNLSYTEELILSRSNVKFSGKNAPDLEELRLQAITKNQIGEGNSSVAVSKENDLVQSNAEKTRSNNSKKSEKYFIPILSESDIKEAFTNAIKSETTLHSNYLSLAMDKAFNDIGKKIRFGKKKENEICWFGEAGYVKSYQSGEVFKYGVGKIKAENNKNIQFKEVSVEELELRMKQAEEQKIQLEQERLKERAEAAQRAIKYFDSYSKNSEEKCRNHKYLTNKRISEITKQISDIRFTEDNRIVLPLRDVEGQIHSLQFISEDGSKKFLKDGEKKGYFFMIGQEKLKEEQKQSQDRDKKERKTINDLLNEGRNLNKNDNTIEKPKEIFIAEGFATAATIYQATLRPVAVCFDAGNLEPVLKNLKDKYRNNNFIIAADNDLWKEINVGKEKAELAAKEHGAQVILPKFGYGHKEDQPTDFNDLAKIEGNNEVEKQIKEQVYGIKLGKGLTLVL